MNRSFKKLKLEVKQPYQPFFDDAIKKWPEISNEKPTDADLAGLAYKLIVNNLDAPFDTTANLVRSVAHDSNLDVTFCGLLPIDNPKPEEVVYIVDIILVAEKYEVKPEDNAMTVELEQLRLNQEFEAMVKDLLLMLCSVGTVI